MKHVCPLCYGSSIPFYKDEYSRCLQCNAVFMHPAFYVDSDTEKSRYEEHNNDITDCGYQKFVSPITDTIKTHYDNTANGLDFGSGTGPVITHVLHQLGYRVNQFDKYFATDRSVLNQQYDFIACCEVVEHFHKPKEEFHLLAGLLKPGGRLLIMTKMITRASAFGNWYYRRDPTHVFFYTPETFTYIKNNFDFDDLEIQERLIILTKRT
jgi:SAM-dependent methyltransferase